MSVQGKIANCFIALLLMAVVGNCSDNITHVYDCEIGQGDGGGGDGVNGSNLEETETERIPPSDGSDATEDGEGQGIRPQGWEDFGKGCGAPEDCSGIPGGGQCINSIMQMIYAPGGYCVGCCNDPGVGKCGPNLDFDCVGVKNEALTYLVCINNCEKDEDCRQEDGYECKPVPYLDEYYPGKKYCMPIVIEQPPEDEPEINPQCDWNA